MWFTFAILSSLFFTASSIIERHLLRGDKDFWAYSFWFSAVGLIVNLPFMLASPQISQKPSFWLLLIGISILITLHNFLNFLSTKYLSPSFKTAITKFRLVWVFLFGIIFLAEILTLSKVVGVTLTILAGIFVIGNLRKTKNSKGILPVFFATIIYSTVITTYSILLREFNPASLTFFIFLFPALINLVLMPNAFTRIFNIAKQYKSLLLVSTASAGFANLLMNYALDTGDQSDIIVTMEASLVAILAAEFFILKEKGNIKLKLAAIVLAIIGAVLVRLG